MGLTARTRSREISTLVVAIAAWVTMRTGNLVSRREGMALIAVYLATVPFLT